MPTVRLVSATLEHLDALEENPATFATLIGSPPEGWPEFPESLTFTREQLVEHPDQGDWWMQFFLDAETGSLVGSGGFVGPPRDRRVEIGYEVAPAFRGVGFGTAGARALVERAWDSGEVDTVIAHTLATENPSTRVLASLGFEKVDEIADDEHGTVWRWSRERPGS